MGAEVSLNDMSAGRPQAGPATADLTGWLRYLAELVAIGLIYFVLAKLSLAQASLHPSATPLWPPTGVALAIVLLRQYRVWPAIWIAAFAANVTTAGSVATSLAIATGNTLESLVGAYLLRRWADGLDVFDTPAGVAKFAAICLGATLISPTLGVGSLALAGYAAWTKVTGIWLTWWMGDLAGALLITPVIVLWARSSARSWEAPELMQSAAVFIVAALVGLVAFGPLFAQTASAGPLAFLAIVPLMWGALNRGQRDTATAALILAGFAVWGTLADGGPFARPNLNDSFLLLLAFLISISVPSLALSANAATRQRHQEYAELVMLELSHRSKNLLAVVQGMAQQVARHSSNFEEFNAAFCTRLRALADTHDLLVQRDWRGAGLAEVMRTQLAPFQSAQATRLTFDGPPLTLTPKAAEQIGLALHELATNASKHGALSVAGGSVVVRWQMEGGGVDAAYLRIEWQESGGPAVGAPTRKGFGHMVITRLVPSALAGNASLDFSGDGLYWTLRVPSAALQQADR
jgi:two-component sensor histidine kinase/integral membrane sensor domain MASE1